MLIPPCQWKITNPNVKNLKTKTKIFVLFRNLLQNFIIIATKQILNNNNNTSYFKLLLHVSKNSKNVQIQSPRRKQIGRKDKQSQ